MVMMNYLPGNNRTEQGIPCWRYLFNTGRNALWCTGADVYGRSTDIISGYDLYRYSLFFYNVVVWPNIKETCKNIYMTAREDERIIAKLYSATV